MIPAPNTGRCSRRASRWIILGAARLAAWFARNPLWQAMQRWFMGLVLGGLAVRLALEERRN